MFYTFTKILTIIITHFFNIHNFDKLSINYFFTNQSNMIVKEFLFFKILISIECFISNFHEFPHSKISKFHSLLHLRFFLSKTLLKSLNPVPFLNYFLFSLLINFFILLKNFQDGFLPRLETVCGKEKDCVNFGLGIFLDEFVVGRPQIFTNFLNVLTFP